MNCLKTRNKMAVLFSEVYGRSNLKQKQGLRQVTSSQLDSTLLSECAGDDYGINLSGMPDEAPKHIPLLLHT